MTSKENCTRLLKPCASVRIDPCDCSHYYQCSPRHIVRRCCAEGVVFNAKTQNCVFASRQICDVNKPWTRCRLEDFGISNHQIQSVSACRKFWPKEMKNWDLTLRRGATERTKTTLATTTPSPVASTTETERWSIATSYRPVSNVTVVQPTRVTVSNGFDFDTPAAKTYIPVIVCGMIALIAFVTLIILWKRRSDVKNFIRNLCCFGGNEKSKSICNPGYGNTIATFDSRLDLTTGENVYNEIPYLNPESVVNRPLPQTPQPRASTFAGFGCLDVAIRKEQEQVQRTNSVCQPYDKLTSSEDRGLIDAQERFASEHQISSAKTHRGKTNMVAWSTTTDRKTQVSEQQQEVDKRKTGRQRNPNATRNGVGRHRSSPGKLKWIKEDLELTTLPNPDSESIAATTREMNSSGEYSGVWHGVSINRKTEMN